ncbi:hypothetical protein MMC31_004908 [Peltigera leucophlebia]|nr:hypothetical protein [Peltigera leucophlebia]
MLFFPNTTTLLKRQDKENHEFLLSEDNQTFLTACQLSKSSNGKPSKDKKSFNSIVKGLERLSDSAKLEDSEDSKDSQNIQNLDISENLKDFENSEESENSADLEDPENVESSSNEKNNTIELDDPNNVEGSSDEEDDSIKLDNQISCQKKRNFSKYA